MQAAAQVISGLLEQIAVGDDEVCALATVYDRDSSGELGLAYASLLYGPPALKGLSVRDWRAAQAPGKLALTHQVADIPEFVYDGGTFVAARTFLSQQHARKWLTEALEHGTMPAIDDVPSASGALGFPSTLIHVFPRDGTPAAHLVGLDRPIFGFFFPLEAAAREELVYPSNWEVAGAYVPVAPHLLLGWSIPTAAVPMESAPEPGLLVGRLSRDAWLASVRATKAWDGIEIVIGRDESDLIDLELEIVEWIDGELVAARRVRLEELDLSGMLVAPFVEIEVPAFARSASHQLALFDRSGRLLDRTARVNFIEKVSVHMNVTLGDAATDASATTSFTIGETVIPALEARLERRAEIESRYREMLEEGVGVRIIPHGANAMPLMQEMLGDVKGELLILDRYFGNPKDWGVLTHVGVPIRVLVGPKGGPPPKAFTNVAVRQWHPKKAVSPQPRFHDRVYLWDGGGITVGTSPSGLGKADSRIARLPDAEVAAWRSRFETYWSSGDFIDLAP